MGKHITPWPKRALWQARIVHRRGTWSYPGEAGSGLKLKDRHSQLRKRLRKGGLHTEGARISLTTNILTWFSKWLGFPRALCLSCRDLRQLLLGLFILMTEPQSSRVLKSIDTRPWSLCIASPSRYNTKKPGLYKQLLLIKPSSFLTFLVASTLRMVNSFSKS